MREWEGGRATAGERVRVGRVGWEAGRVGTETLGPGAKVGEDGVEEGKERERQRPLGACGWGRGVQWQHRAPGQDANE